MKRPELIDRVSREFLTHPVKDDRTTIDCRWCGEEIALCDSFCPTKCGFLGYVHTTGSRAGSHKCGREAQKKGYGLGPGLNALPRWADASA